MKMDPKPTKNVHSDHRLRMKERFLKQGLSTFHSHEILEMLLYYALPRKDTNALAHDLIRHFGSLNEVFDATPQQLCEVSGVSEHTAILIKMIPQLAQKYMSEVSIKKENLADYDSAGRYFVSAFVGEIRERVLAAYLDNGMNLIKMSVIGDGDVNASQVSVRKIVSEALANDAAFLILAHNHPHGTILPSNDDLTCTNICGNALSVVGIKLVEHYVIAGNRYMGIIKKSVGAKQDT